VFDKIQKVIFQQQMQCHISASIGAGAITRNQTDNSWIKQSKTMEEKPVAPPLKKKEPEPV
jgi:hypothetical protein